MRRQFERSVDAAVGRGIDCLLHLQDKDGFWREFELQPGASEAWTTAWVGWCLAGAVIGDCQRRVQVEESCKRAVGVLWKARRAGGWGYNRKTGPDADSTAWALRFLIALGQRLDPAAYLAPYIDPGGGVHTFREAGLGSWTEAHDDVAANAGLALYSGPASQRLFVPVRERLVRRFPGETFWWSTQTYGVAWVLRFLNRTGGLSDSLRNSARDWLVQCPESASAFETVHRLMAVMEMDGPDPGALPLVNGLLDLAGAQGWPGSTFLLVPARDGGPQGPPNPELRGLLTTALAVRVLSEWIAAQRGTYRPSFAHSA